MMQISSYRRCNNKRATITWLWFKGLARIMNSSSLGRNPSSETLGLPINYTNRFRSDSHLLLETEPSAVVLHLSGWWGPVKRACDAKCWIQETSASRPEIQGPNLTIQLIACGCFGRLGDKCLTHNRNRTSIYLECVAGTFLIFVACSLMPFVQFMLAWDFTMSPSEPWSSHGVCEVFARCDRVRLTQRLLQGLAPV
jgi:hypothetical protein